MQAAKLERALTNKFLLKKVPHSLASQEVDLDSLNILKAK
jgi:hypothetical protein